MPVLDSVPLPASDAPLKLLFVKLKHIGDALIMTPALMAVRAHFPKSEIWVVVREGTEGILAGCPAINKLLTVAPVESENRGLSDLWRDIRTGLQLRGQRFDYAFELTDGDRGRWLVGLSGARNRCVNISHYPLNGWWKRWFNRLSDTPWTQGHRVEKDFGVVADFLGIKGEIPGLCFERSRSKEPDFLKGKKDFVVVHPGTRWKKKRWPKEHWITLGHELLKRTQHIVVSSGPDADEKAFAAELVAAWGENRSVSSDGKLDWAHLAGCLHRARAFIGVDTAAMHLAAACQCPIVGIFGYSVVSQWRPWKVECRLINKAAGLDQSEHPADEVMHTQTPDMVLHALGEIIRPQP